MKPSSSSHKPWASERGLSFATLLFLPLVYLSFSFYEVSLLNNPPSVESDPVVIPIRRVEDDTPRFEAVQLLRAFKDADLVVEQPTPSMRNRRTMVLLVNFRDSKRCGETRTSMFQHAVEPELLRITSTKVKASDANDPTVARHITEKEIGDEEFCLGLDSHLVFMPDWDTRLVQNWEATENAKAILTVYPKSTEYLEDHSMDNKMGLMCYARIETPDDDAMVQYRAVHWLEKTNTTKPRLMSQFAGGFNFGSCQAYKDAPNDPYTPILFYGEEYARAARLWTHGYDLYVPSVEVVHHYFEARQKIWDEDWPARFLTMQRSKRRVRAFLGLPTSSDDYDTTDMDRFALGTKRTWAQWQIFSGIDPLAAFTPDTIEQFKHCGELEFVPYES